MVENVSTNGMRRFGDDRDIVILEYELEKEDVMKFKPLYEALHIFFNEEGFQHPQSGDDLYEDLYWERWTPSNAKEQHIWWRLKKDKNKYLRQFIQFDIQTLNVTKAEIAYNNKKVSGEKIDCIVRVKCILQFDINDLFKKSFAWKMRRVFFNKVYHEEIEQNKIDLYNFGMKLQRLVKGYFEMTVDAPAPQIFQPPMGYKE